MENIDPDLIIKVIIAVPKSRNFYNFYLNDSNEKRSMKHKDLAEFVAKLCPEVGGKALKMIYEFRSFYVEIETNTLLELLETPEKPEAHRTVLFGNRKKILKTAKDERKKEKKEEFVDKRKQIIFSNILKLIKK